VAYPERKLYGIAVVPLPKLVRDESKYRFGLVAFVLFVTLYAFTNSLDWRVPTSLPPTWLDENIPLLPTTVWIYASYVLIFVSSYVIEKDIQQINRFVYASAATNIVSALIYLFWPTTFPRPELTGDGLSVDLLAYIWRLDSPVNCFPSLHVSSSILPALLLWRNHSRLRILYLFWALAISISTMTIKQHHSADVVAGALLAGCMYWLFFERASYAQSGDPRSADCR
jgi:membrane-associated phospholipid phosphatase